MKAMCYFELTQVSLLLNEQTTFKQLQVIARLTYSSKLSNISFKYQ